MARDSSIERVVQLLSHPATPDLLINNRAFQRMLTEGITCEIATVGSQKSPFEKLWLLDLEDIDNNDWLAVNQFTVVENVNGHSHNRRADVVLFVNGIPLAVLELKNPTDEKADTLKAFNQLQTYKLQIPSLFTSNEVLVASDGGHGAHRQPERRLGPLHALAHHRWQ